MIPETLLPPTLTPGLALDHTIHRIVYGPWDASRCRICGWPVYPDLSLGCILGNCSMRPVPSRRADAPYCFSNPQTVEDKSALLDAVRWLVVHHGFGFPFLFTSLFGASPKDDACELDRFALHVVRLVLMTAKVTTLDEVPS